MILNPVMFVTVIQERIVPEKESLNLGCIKEAIGTASVMEVLEVSRAPEISNLGVVREISGLITLS